MKLGLHNAARYHYYPGWHEPGTVEEVVFTKKAYDALPADLKVVVDRAAEADNIRVLADYNTKNAIGLQELKTKFKGKNEVLQLPVDVLRAFRKHAAETLEEEGAKDAMAKKVHESFKKFRALYNAWDQVSENPYQRLIASV